MENEQMSQAQNDLNMSKIAKTGFFEWIAYTASKLELSEKVKNE